MKYKKLYFSFIFIPAMLLGLLDVNYGRDRSGLIKREIPIKAEDVHPLLVGNDVPDITVTKLNGTSVSLKTLVSEQPSVLIFYRGGWCPYCNTHLAKLRKIEPDLKKIGYQILAVTPDLPEKIKETIQKQKLGYTILSDSQMKAAQSFGVAFKVDDQTIEKYKKYQIDLEASSGQKHHLLPVPAVFIADQKGVIQFQYVNPNYKVRLEPSVLMAAAKAALSRK